VSYTVRTYGGLDAVHINAGDMGAVSKDTDVVDMDLGVWDRTFGCRLSTCEDYRMVPDARGRASSVEPGRSHT
jgi:hypothetical protein